MELQIRKIPRHVEGQCPVGQAQLTATPGPVSEHLTTGPGKRGGTSLSVSTREELGRRCFVLTSKQLNSLKVSDSSWICQRRGHGEPLPPRQGRQWARPSRGSCGFLGDSGADSIPGPARNTRRRKEGTEEILETTVTENLS